MSVRSEINNLAEANRTLLRVQDVEEWARERPSSSLYKELKFDDEAGAARLWRLQHIRRLIAIYVVDEESERVSISLTIDRQSGGGYRNLYDVAEREDLCTIMLRDALQELDRVRAKYEALATLANIWKELDDIERPSKQAKLIKEKAQLSVA